jgi:hypothetical protein
MYARASGADAPRRERVPAGVDAAMVDFSVLERRECRVPVAMPESKTTQQGWRAMLPLGWADYSYGPEPPAELIEGRTVVYRWNGEKFLAVR